MCRYQVVEFSLARPLVCLVRINVFNSYVVSLIYVFSAYLNRTLILPLYLLISKGHRDEAE